MVSGDPLLKTSQWQANRRYWVANATACELCGVALDVSVGARGPHAMDVGHIVSRRDAKRMGWSAREINALSNTRPECRTCSRSAGGRVGGHARSRPAVMRPVTSRAW